MASNALSTKRFSIKNPSICKNPRCTPPLIPPPLLPDVTLWVNAQITWRHWLFPIDYAASCHCKYDAGAGYWHGHSSENPEHRRFGINLYIEQENSLWYATIWYSWPDAPGWGWFTDSGPLKERPYRSMIIRESVLVPVYRETSVLFHEVPS